MFGASLLNVRQHKGENLGKIGPVKIDSHGKSLQKKVSAIIFLHQNYTQTQVSFATERLFFILCCPPFSETLGHRYPDTLNNQPHIHLISRGCLLCIYWVPIPSQRAATGRPQTFSHHFPYETRHLGLSNYHYTPRN